MFIKLTPYNADIVETIYINPEHIVSVYKGDNTTCVYMFTGLIYEVKESVEDILHTLGGTINYQARNL